MTPRICNRIRLERCCLDRATPNKKSVSNVQTIPCRKFHFQLLEAVSELIRQSAQLGKASSRAALAPARREVHELQQNVRATQPCRGMCPGGPGSSICFVLRVTFMRKSDKIRTCFATYTPFGNSMRSLALLRLVGGEKSGSRRVLHPGDVLEDMFWNIDMFTCIVGSKFP